MKVSAESLPGGGVARLDNIAGGVWVESGRGTGDGQLVAILACEVLRAPYSITTNY